MFDAIRLLDKQQRYLRMCAEPAELLRQAQQAQICWAAMLQASNERAQAYTEALQTSTRSDRLVQVQPDVIAHESLLAIQKSCSV